MTKRLKVGLIGMGGIAKTHMPGWDASPDAEIIAGADILPSVFPLWREKFGMTRFYDTGYELIDQPEIDIIDICTPNMFHAPLAIAALNAGKHVICEKPLAPTPAEIQSMIEARDRSGKLLMTAQHQRFGGDAQAMKAHIDTGVLGDVYHARAWYLRRSGLPLRDTFIYKSHSGGGPCIDIGVHVLDMALWLMGHPKPITVTGTARDLLVHHEGAFTSWGRKPVPQDIDVEDFAAAFVRFDNGATLSLEVSWLMHHPIPGEEQHVWLYGTEGGAEYPSATFASTDYAARQLIDHKLLLLANTMEPHALECVEFAHAVAEGLPSPVPPEQSLDVQNILYSIYRSQETGREIRLDGQD